MPTDTGPQPVAPLGRFLRSFALSNVRTFRSRSSIDFCNPDGTVAQWTVILGENGTGKTTLLQYLAGMTLVYDESTPRPTNREGKSQPPPLRPLLLGGQWFDWHALNLPRPWNDPVELTAEMEITEAVSSISDPRIKHAKAHPPLGLKLKFKSEQDRKANITAQYSVPSSLGILNEFRLFGYGASRHVAGPASPYLSSDSFYRQAAASPTMTLFSDDLPLISPEQWLLGLHHVSRSEGQAQEAAERVFKSACDCLASVLPGIREITVRPFGLVQGQTGMTVFCKTPYAEVPFSALGVGYRTMAAWLGDFLRRMYETYPMLDQPNTGSAVVLIDEFDLHMHPRWQLQAMRALSRQFPNTQFIITVHSPLVVQATEGRAKLVVLRPVDREDGTKEVLIDSKPEYAAGWRVDQILASDLYGIDPRSEVYTKLIEQRVRLLQKEVLTDEEQQLLKALDERLEREAPPGVSSASKKLFDDLQEALKPVVQPKPK